MGAQRVPGLFITGTDTDVGKTYVGALVATELREAGYRVGVYKPAASGCHRQGGELVSDDAVALWHAAGRPGQLDCVCPQRFLAPLAPHLAARAEGKELDFQSMLAGLQYWSDRSDVILVEGAGGLLAPMGDRVFVADLVRQFGFPLIVVARNALGTLNHTLLTLHAARTLGLAVAGVVLNWPSAASDDPSTAWNRQQLSERLEVPLLAEASWKSGQFDSHVDWYALAR